MCSLARLWGTTAQQSRASTRTFRRTICAAQCSGCRMLRAMSKSKDKRREQPPPRLLRAFSDHPVEQVTEVARLLYAVRPFSLGDVSELKWNSLARQAFDF